MLDRRISINTQLNFKVPYHSQLNNLEHPLGACNVVTCVAIVLKYYGIDSRSAQEINNDVQLEDVLFRTRSSNNPIIAKAIFSERFFRV